MTKKSVFYRIYFAVIALFFVALTVALIWLGGWLKSYEAAQPQNLINTIVENKLKNKDIDFLKQDCSLKISKYETEQNLTDLIDKFVDGKQLSSVVCATRPEGYDAAYTIKSGEEKFLNVYLKKDENSASFLPKYIIIGAEFDKDLYKTITVSMPQNVSVTINGIALTEKERKDDIIPDFVADYLKGETVIRQQSAVVDYLLSNEITITAKKDGKDISLTKNDNAYTVFQYIDNDVKKAVQTIATEGSKAYAGYMQGDATLAEVASYFNTNCDFYKNIRSSYTDHILEHTPEGFINVKNDEVFKYSDNIYSCRVKFTQVLKRNGMTYKIHFDKYVFLEKNGGNFRIIDIKSPEGE